MWLFLFWSLDAHICFPKSPSWLFLPPICRVWWQLSVAFPFSFLVVWTMPIFHFPKVLLTCSHRAYQTHQSLGKRRATIEHSSYNAGHNFWLNGGQLCCKKLPVILRHRTLRPDCVPGHIPWRPVVTLSPCLRHHISCLLPALSHGSVPHFVNRRPSYPCSLPYQGFTQVLQWLFLL